METTRERRHSCRLKIFLFFTICSQVMQRAVSNVRDRGNYLAGRAADGRRLAGLTRNASGMRMPTRTTIAPATNEVLVGTCAAAAIVRSAAFTRGMQSRAYAGRRRSRRTERGAR